MAKLEDNIKKLAKMKNEGYNWVCVNCHLVYKEKRQEFYHDGHGGRNIDMCGCGCDIYLTIDKMIGELEKRLISPQQ